MESKPEDIKLAVSIAKQDLTDRINIDLQNKFKLIGDIDKNVKELKQITTVWHQFKNALISNVVMYILIIIIIVFNISILLKKACAEANASSFKVSPRGRRY